MEQNQVFFLLDRLWSLLVLEWMNFRNTFDFVRLKTINISDYGHFFVSGAIFSQNVVLKTFSIWNNTSYTAASGGCDSTLLSIKQKSYNKTVFQQVYYTVIFSKWRVIAENKSLHLKKGIMT